MQVAAASSAGGAAVLRVRDGNLEFFNNSETEAIPAETYVTGQVVYPVA